MRAVSKFLHVGCDRGRHFLDEICGGFGGGNDHGWSDILGGELKVDAGPSDGIDGDGRTGVEGCEGVDKSVRMGENIDREEEV